MRGMGEKIGFYLARTAYSLLSWSARHDHCRSSREFKVRRLLDTARDEGVGYYSSSVVEKYFTDLAKESHVSLGEPQSGSCLIVFTRPYFSGGHTRVAERWIEADRDRKYSVAFTAERIDELPERMKRAVEDSCGDVIYVNRGDEISTGLELRKVASRFESVVLFSHMDDVTPLIAFGTEEFKSPVGFYNHADHRFWLGVSISDLVGELRDWGADLSRRYRGVARQTLIGVPCECEPLNEVGKIEARRMLGLSVDGLVVTCVGRYGKMVPANGINMLDTVKQLLEWNSSLTFLMVGISEDQIPGWREVAYEYGGRLKCYSEVSHERLKFYHFAADLVLDSRPMGGITGLADALRARRPILSCMGNVEWVAKSPAYCKNDIEMVLQAKKLLMMDEESRRLIMAEEISALERLAGRVAFKRNIDVFFSVLLSNPHRVMRFEETPTPYIDLDKFYASRKPEKYYSRFILNSIYWDSTLGRKLYSGMKRICMPRARGGGASEPTSRRCDILAVRFMGGFRHAA